MAPPGRVIMNEVNVEATILKRGMEVDINYFRNVLMTCNENRSENLDSVIHDQTHALINKLNFQVGNFNERVNILFEQNDALLEKTKCIMRLHNLSTMTKNNIKAMIEAAKSS